MTTDSNLHPLQKFEAKNIHRSQINEAEYNPRIIRDSARKKLNNNLEKKGLLDTLVWNEVTGNLVSGHQRLAKLDAHVKSLDYIITVAVVHLTLQEEIEQNLFFNNGSAQGEFDDDKLIDIFKSSTLPSIDYYAAGLDESDIAFYGVTIDLENIDSEPVEETIAQFEAVKQQKKDAIPPEVAAARKEAVKAAKQQGKSETDTYVTLTFSNQSAKRAFMERIGEQADNLYIKGEMFVEKFFSE